MFARAGNRKIIEGWPLLPVETEVNGESKSTNERGPSLVGLLWDKNSKEDPFFPLPFDLTSPSITYM